MTVDHVRQSIDSEDINDYLNHNSNYVSDCEKALEVAEVPIESMGCRVDGFERPGVANLNWCDVVLKEWKRIDEKLKGIVDTIENNPGVRYEDIISFKPSNSPYGFTYLSRHNEDDTIYYVDIVPASIDIALKHSPEILMTKVNGVPDRVRQQARSSWIALREPHIVESFEALNVEAELNIPVLGALGLELGGELEASKTLFANGEVELAIAVSGKLGAAVSAGKSVEVSAGVKAQASLVHRFPSLEAANQYLEKATEILIPENYWDAANYVWDEYPDFINHLTDKRSISELRIQGGVYVEAEFGAGAFESQLGLSAMVGVDAVNGLKTISLEGELELELDVGDWEFKGWAEGIIDVRQGGEERYMEIELVLGGSVGHDLEYFGVSGDAALGAEVVASALIDLNDPNTSNLFKKADVLGLLNYTGFSVQILGLAGGDEVLDMDIVGVLDVEAGVEMKRVLATKHFLPGWKDSK